MSFWTAVVAIFAIACGAWVRSQKYRAIGDGKRGREGWPEGGNASSSREDELEREVEEMRKRIAVLERIAIDEKRGNDLAREIESLRD